MLWMQFFNSKFVCRGFTLYSSGPGKGLWMRSSPVPSTCRKHQWKCCHCCILSFTKMNVKASPLISLCFLPSKALLAKKETLRTTIKQEMGLKNPQFIFSHLNKQIFQSWNMLSSCVFHCWTNSIFKDKYSVIFWKKWPNFCFPILLYCVLYLF